jgi:predicted PurR-regulated permease PerM
VSIPVATTNDRLVSARALRQGAVLALAGLLAGVALYLARDAVTPFVVALLVGYVILPVVDGLAARRVPRWLAILIVYAGLLAALYLIVRLVLPPLVEQILAIIAALPAAAAHLRDYYLALDLAPDLRAWLDAILGDLRATIAGLDPHILIGPIVASAGGLVGLLLAYAFAPFFVFYVVLDRDRLQRGFDRSLPAEWRPDIWAVLGIGDTVFGQWIRTTILLGAILAAASFVGMWVFAFVVDPVFGQFAIVLAVIAFFSEFIPIIGPFFPLIGGVVVGLTVSPFAALLAGLFYFALAQVEANLLVPRIQGRALSLHPAVVIAVLILGAAAAGLLGAMLAMPVVATATLIIRYLFRRASGLIDPPPPPLAPEPGPLVDDLIPGEPRAGEAPGPPQAPAVEDAVDVPPAPSSAEGAPTGT